MSEPPTDPIVAAGYLRVSDANQNVDGTPETQRQRIEAYAAMRSAELGRPIRIVRWYQDVYTGADSYYDKRRQGFQDLRKAVALREYGIVLAYKDDRIARGSEILSFCFECARSGTAVETALDGPLRTEGLPGSFGLLVLGEGSREELRKIRDRAADGMRTRAINGRRLPGNRPRYGYRWDDPTEKGGLVPCPTSAPVVQRIFQEFVRGTSLRSIAAGLQVDRIPTPTQHAGRRSPSRVWGHSAVREILADETYAGRAVALKYQSVSVIGSDGAKRRNWRLRSETGRVQLPAGTVPALVTSETWAWAQERLDENRRRATYANPNPDATLLRAGFAFCGYCGHRLVTDNQPNGRGRMYLCGPKTRQLHGCPAFSINASILDPYVWERVTRALDAPDVLYVEMRAQREREDAVDDQDARDLMAISLELEELDRGLGSLAAAMRTLAGSGHAAAVLLEQVELLDAHRGRLLERKSEADARRAQGIASENALRDLVAAVGARQDSGGGLSVQQKRELLRLLAVKAFVRKGGDGERIVVTAKVDLDRFAAPDPERPGRKRI